MVTVLPQRWIAITCDYKSLKLRVLEIVRSKVRIAAYRGAGEYYVGFFVRGLANIGSDSRLFIRR